MSGGTNTALGGGDPFRALADTTPDAIIAADVANRIVYANPAAHELTGRPEGELVGQPVTTIIPERFREQHLQGFERFIRTREAHLVGSMVTVQLLRSDDTEVPVELSLGVAGSGADITLTALIRDVSEPLRRQRLAAAQIAVTSVLTDSSGEDQEERILASLTAGLEWDLGALWLPAGERLELCELWQADPTRTAPFARACAESAFAFGHGAPGIAWETREAVWMEDLQRQGLFARAGAAAAAGLRAGVALPVVSAGEVLAVLELFARHSEQLDDPLREMLATVASQVGESLRRRQHAADLARSNAELEQFASVVAHDLHDPLRTIAGFADLLVAGRAGEEQREEFIRLIAASARRGQNVLDGLLELARVGTSEPVTAEVALEPVLADALVALHSRVEETGARVEHGPLPTVRCDGTLIGQVFQNLLSNAMKFRGDAAPHIRVAAQRLPAAWRIDVSDNGRGIGQDQPVFEIFHRFGTGEEVGLGLGLAICRRVVERHGGTIWFDSEVGTGTTFSFTLPD